MYRTRDNQTFLYMVPLKPEQNENMTEVKIPESHFVGSLYESKSKADLCNFLHLALWIPCTSTLISAIKNNFLSPGPGLAKQLVQKFLQISESTVKGHIRKSYKGNQSTHPKEPNETPSKNPTRTHSVFLQATDFSGNFFTDQTGWFPVRSVRGFKYIMVAYDHDSSTIHAEPMNNHSGPKLLKSYTTIHKPTLRTRASTENALPRQRVPNSLAKIHDCKIQTLPTRSAPPPQTKFSRTSNRIYFNTYCLDYLLPKKQK